MHGIAAVTPGGQYFPAGHWVATLVEQNEPTGQVVGLAELAGQYMGLVQAILAVAPAGQ